LTLALEAESLALVVKAVHTSLSYQLAVPRICLLAYVVFDCVCFCILGTSRLYSRSVLLCVSVCLSGCESPSKRHSVAATPVRKVGLKDVLKVINDVTSSTSHLVSSNTTTSSSSSSSSSSVTLPLQQTVAVCTLLMMTDDRRTSKHLINTEVALGKVQHALY